MHNLDVQMMKNNCYSDDLKSEKNQFHNNGRNTRNSLKEFFTRWPSIAIRLNLEHFLYTYVKSVNRFNYFNFFIYILQTLAYNMGILMNVYIHLIKFKTCNVYILFSYRSTYLQTRLRYYSIWANLYCV